MLEEKGVVEDDVDGRGYSRRGWTLVLGLWYGQNGTPKIHPCVRTGPTSLRVLCVMCRASRSSVFVVSCC